MRRIVRNQSSYVSTIRNNGTPRIDVGNSKNLSSGRTIVTARYSRGLYILDDDTSGSSISRTTLMSSYFSTSEHDFML
ncbi:uncharacterized protein E5676_scaffold388G00500 [Cucumis melo var. makuwa]|uniref:Uncharacterized protein n=1 Tax=Cucumis melo var. makuwa TaxID=1194695 RepID=A0A5D3BSS0_CUCMM|nr:uncharacterized protein E5676_scaffold388G00500 [Cucumis melo var. makuwa]